MCQPAHFAHMCSCSLSDVFDAMAVLQNIMLLSFEVHTVETFKQEEQCVCSMPMFGMWILLSLAHQKQVCKLSQCYCLLLASLLSAVLGWRGWFEGCCEKQRKCTFSGQFKPSCIPGLLLA